jgi:hypothetical protein
MRARPSAVTTTIRAAMASRLRPSERARIPAPSRWPRARRASAQVANSPPMLAAPTAAGIQAGVSGTAAVATARTIAASRASSSNTGTSATTACPTGGAIAGASRRKATARAGAVPAP